MASALARLCSRAWQRQQQQQLVHSRLAAIVLVCLCGACVPVLHHDMFAMDTLPLSPLIHSLALPL